MASEINKIKIIFISSLLIALAQKCYSQSNDSINTKKEDAYTITEVMPEYIGGFDAMGKFLRENIKYPKKARKKDKQGIVYITFVVEKDGHISEARVLKGVADAPELDKEALRVVNLMPKWKPGTQSGKKVRVQYNLPIKFTLKDKKENNKSNTKTTEVRTKLS
ncbi:MAG: energy transducer TonB [Bacteroidia bacterium]|nr:energy transducer TonB [Bacteroidia bacterium]